MDGDYEHADTQPVAPVTPKKRKRPSRTVQADHFYVEGEDGERYYEHVGEWIRFVPAVRLDTVLMAMDLQNLQGVDLGGADSETAEALRTAFLHVTEELSKSIIEWHWTDASDTALPSPPTREALRALPMDELMWIVGASFGQTDTEERGEGLAD